MSYLSAAVAIAPAVAPIFGGFVEVWLGWRANLVSLAVYGTLALVATVLLLPETNPSPDPTATHPFRIIGNFGSFLRNRLYLGFLLGVALSYAGIFCFISGSSFVLVDLVGVTPDLYGFCFGAIVIGYIIGSMTGGRLSKRFPPDRMVMVGTALMFIGFLNVFLSISGGFEINVVPFLIYFAGLAVWANAAIETLILRYGVMTAAIALALAFFHYGEVLFWHKQVVFWATIVIVMYFMFKEEKKPAS